MALADAIAGKRKKQKVNLGKKGSFTISHPGWTSGKAKAAGMTTKQWSEAHAGDQGVAGRRARSAIGLMAMGGKR